MSLTKLKWAAILSFVVAMIILLGGGFVAMDQLPPYPGKVTLFWAQGEEESADEAMRWWRKIAGELELHIMPGTPHQKSITSHAEAVAEMLRSCLEIAQSRL
jgi:hypothetical protein